MAKNKGKNKAFAGISRLRQNYGERAGSERITAGKRVFVAMSGGVDSSVAAFLLKEQGYDVTGVFIRSYNLDGCAERDAADARLVADKLGIPFYVFDFEEEYKREVVDYMVKGYREGRTPNPDVMCNKHIKFGLFLEKARALGADYIATGHYVRLRRLPDIFAQSVSGATPKSYFSQKYRSSLFAAKDTNKDQSYFLWTLKQEQLKYCLFPIGDYLKPEVRAIACQAGLPTADKKDSQGVCFLGRVALEEFLKQYIPEKRGAVLTTDGREIGEHNGAQFYTIGQRHGLDLKEKNAVLGLKTRSKTEPHYIAEKNVAENTIIVAEGDQNPALYRKEIELADVNFVDSVFREEAVMARVRYRQPLTGATLRKENSAIKLTFNEPQKFVASGQSAVFYSAEEGSLLAGRRVLGGGVIK
ncbi:MAG: tRNA-specific 2-thiouridylase MnmA [Candidatus Jorgensenbacteria bacterium GW2011_GWA1_48_11]|uniref:tRNA-specific 2-thiouridylase MnmA n=1 Tax=Candidatus Jorgensenbacteria bacterium GW2011_GWA1_48_11 TaxID=1618660 RepID=A0A0G1WKT1_9BACT|nr:MAG: tRNA-specific 2-thiouridylase MnmA [Candidatus Jorgensenbacteria bacterium GW2011_GWA1_48_11]KKW12331.1 MAG: tRNA-specific 2-thiouridylase MnmA [Candidatus Jorgensenbacteria bacterium GW2011_GWB1_49_9]